MIHYQNGNLNVAQAGQAAKHYSFDADGRLALSAPPLRDTNRREVSAVFVWERLP
jgi:hypothetical protein